MSRLANEMLVDIEKDVIEYGMNFDNTRKEPLVLPSRFPNLLVNGSIGIAVGMATNIPPHNLGEVIDATVYMIDHPDCTVPELMQYIKGPDFPTYGTIYGTAGIREAYMTGRGRVRVRAKAHFEEKRGRTSIIITELPYQVNRSLLLENMVNLVKTKRIDGISDIRNESGRAGMRIVVEVKKDANAQVVLNLLYKYTQLQDTCAVNMLALVEGEPKVLNLKEVLYHYIRHQEDVIRRRTQFELNRAEREAHIYEGLKIAIDHIDEVIQIIRSSANVGDAREKLQARFGLSEAQSQAIVDMTLGRLSGLERQKIEERLQALYALIEELKGILADETKLTAIIKDDLQKIKDKYGDERRTSIETVSGEVDIEDLIPEETCVFTLTHEGYIKRTTLDTYQAQNRGGRGVQGMTQKDDDFTEELFVGSTHDYMLFMTNQGRVYRLKGYQVPEGSRTAKGSHIVNLLQLQEGEKVTLMLQQKAGVDEDNTYATMVTKQGLIKRTPLSQFRNIRKMGLIAIALNEGDSLVWSHLTKGDDEIIVATHDGAAIRFTEDGARSMGRTGHGVRVIKLREGDYVVGAGVCRPGANVLTISEEGKGRRSRIDDYRITKRGGLGIRNYSNGNVAGIKIVDDTDDLILISQNGILIRIHAADINVQSRYGSGVRVMRLVEDDKVAVVARVDRDNDAETAKIEDTGETDPTPEELAAIEAEELAQEAAEDAAPENDTEE